MAVETVAVDEHRRGWIQDMSRRSDLEDSLLDCGGDRRDARHEEACLGHAKRMVPPGHPTNTWTHLDLRAQGDARGRHVGSPIVYMLYFLPAKRMKQPTERV